MTHLENAIKQMHSLSAALDGLACEAHDGTLEPAELTDVSKDLTEMVEELINIQNEFKSLYSLLDQISELRT